MSQPPEPPTPQVSPHMPGRLRQRRRLRTKAQLQGEAIALFAEKGYEQTSVEDIAHAAAISARTFYRYFACKEDVVLWDEYDELPAGELWNAHEGEDPYTLMVRRLRELTAQLYHQDPQRLLQRTRLCYTVPAIRARFINQQLDMLGPYYTQLAEATGVESDDLQLLVPLAAAFAAMLVAMERWQRNDGREDLATLVDEALAALATISPTRRQPAPEPQPQHPG
jgi:AcrR family transcriptional regulator